jgi:hypothetical protein
MPFGFWVGRATGAGVDADMTGMTGDGFLHAGRNGVNRHPTASLLIAGIPAFFVETFYSRSVVRVSTPAQYHLSNCLLR